MLSFRSWFSYSVRLSLVKVLCFAPVFRVDTKWPVGEYPIFRFLLCRNLRKSLSRQHGGAAESVRRSTPLQLVFAFISFFCELCAAFLIFSVHASCTAPEILRVCPCHVPSGGCRALFELVNSSSVHWCYGASAARLSMARSSFFCRESGFRSLYFFVLGKGPCGQARRVPGRWRREWPSSCTRLTVIRKRDSSLSGPFSKSDDGIFWWRYSVVSF